MRIPRLRDLNIATHIVYLWVPHYLVDCPRCGLRCVDLTMARRYARCTRRFEYWLFQLTKNQTFDKTS